jgi:hypothetical protein
MPLKPDKGQVAVDRSHIEDQLAKDYDLLKKIEDRWRVEDDPKRREKIKLDINDLKQQIQNREVELATLPFYDDCPSRLVPSHPVLSATNPFNYGSPVPPERFYGCQQNIRDVKYRIGAITAQSINIVGFRRSGKTSLLQYIQRRPEVFCILEKKPLIVLLDLQDNRFHTPSGILEGLRRGIAKFTASEPWTKAEAEDPYAVEDGLQALVEQGYRLIVMLDEFERIGARLDEFQDWGEDWRSKACAGLLTLVISSKRPLDELYKTLNLTSPFDNIFAKTILGGLEPEAYRRLMHDGFGLEGAGLGTEITAIQDWIEEWAGALPYYLQMAASLCWQNQDLEVVQKEFSFQAMSRFQELWDDLIELEHHALRYAAGLHLLSQPQAAICDSLQRHGLLRSDGKLFSRAFGEFLRGLR